MKIHSFMQPAAEGMKIALERGLTIKAPSKPLLSGVSGQLVRTPAEVAGHLVDQIDKSVRWADGLRKLRQEGIGRMIVRPHRRPPLEADADPAPQFMGPGKALGNLARRDQERGHWKGEVDRTGGAVEIGSVATAEDLQRVRNMFTAAAQQPSPSA